MDSYQVSFKTYSDLVNSTSKFRSNDASETKSSKEDKLEDIKKEINNIQTFASIFLDLSLDLADDDITASEMCCYGLCNAAVKYLDIAATEGPRDSRIPLIVDLIWTILESYLSLGKVDDESVGVTYQEDYLKISKTVIDFEYVVNVLMDTLCKTLHDGYRLADKECRNEMAIILTQLAVFPLSHPFLIQTRKLNTLFSYACFAEAGSKGWPFYVAPMAKVRNFATVFDVDIQFKHILWILISDILYTYFSNKKLKAPIK
jgi:hypothetical protein